VLSSFKGAVVVLGSSGSGSAAAAACILLLLMSFFVTCLFSMALHLNQRRLPPLRLQVSDCSNLHVTCDAPSVVVFRSESVQRFSGMASKLLFRPALSVPVSPFTTFVVSLYINPYILVCFRSVLRDVSVRWYCHISKHPYFILYVRNCYIWPVYCNLNEVTPLCVCIVALLFILPSTQL
jgi:hypothetical protein